jgi:hypothetical protein
MSLPEKPRGATKFPGIMGHAKTLGVNVFHLREVLLGNRLSPQLLHRYIDLAKPDSVISVVLRADDGFTITSRETAEQFAAQIGVNNCRLEGNRIVLLKPVCVRLKFDQSATV